MAVRRSSPLVGGALLLFVACSSLAPSASLGYELTAANVRKAATEIHSVIVNPENEATAPAGGRYKQFVAAFIRLAFHACVGARCVGCLNVNDPSNNGLNASVTALERVRESLANGADGFNITRGDLWALAAKVAFHVGVLRASVSSGAEVDAVRFRYGREDCDTAPYTNEMEKFPDRRWGTDAALKYFAELGFSAREVAALMGFHTLGVVRDGPSKVVGQWVGAPDVISNGFYRDLRNMNWTQNATTFNGTGQAEIVYTWGRRDNPSFIMINTDVAIVKNFTVVDNGTGQSNCLVIRECPASSTESDAEQFAGNATLWRLEAGHALTKLIERGYGGGGDSGDLSDPVPDPTTSTPVTAASTTASGVRSGEARGSSVAMLCAATVALLNHAASSRRRCE